MKTSRRKPHLSGELSSTTGRNTRPKTSEDGRGNALPIPTDLIIEIFTRLPLKSIAICRCVSKTWSSLLRRSDFTELFLSLSKSCTLSRLLLAYQKGRDLFFFSAPQPQNPDENSSPVVATYHMKFSFHACLLGSFKLSGLDHGLVGLTSTWIGKGREPPLVPMMCNPSTGQSLLLPRVKTKRVKAMSLFGYDPIDKQVKVLSMPVSQGSVLPVAEEYQVVTLGTGKLSQRMINCGRELCYYPHLRGKCINGVLYYPSIDMSTESHVLVCFDVRSEKFNFIKVDKFFTEGTMINYNGKLGLVWSEGWLSRNSRSVNLCVLEDIEKQEWSKHVYVLPALWEDIVGRALLSFVGMTRTNEIVMRSLSPLYLFYFNTEKNTVVRVEIEGLDLSEYTRVHIFLDHVENVTLM
ncbi:F-box protein DOR [Raphanus sativus]|uniref:F-box protein DOR n=1 Tax=Raphanus sativus TaxID=3726 RepID=A0A6J0NCM4_RAPSA|nr:F-box protein DOR [Raphanus sativus]KAJ4903421.1 F-box protein DOR [Raphanus sativus]